MKISYKTKLLNLKILFFGSEKIYKAFDELFKFKPVST